LISEKQEWATKRVLSSDNKGRAFDATLIIVPLLPVNFDKLVKSQIPMAKKKAPNSRRANPE